MIVVPRIEKALSIDLAAFDAVRVDYDLDDGKGDRLVREIRRVNSRIAIVGVSSHSEGNLALCSAGANASCAKADFSTIRQVLLGLVTD